VSKAQKVRPLYGGMGDMGNSIDSGNVYVWAKTRLHTLNVV